MNTPEEVRKMTIIFFRQLTFVVLAAAFVVAAHVTGLGQSTKPSPSPVNVTVVNTPAQPVPVTGTVNVGNLGSSPLPVSGVVGVENATGSSLLTRNVDGPTRQRVFHSFYANDPGYRVPDGKLLVIDYISGIVVKAQTDSAPMMEVNDSNVPSRFYYLPPNSWNDLFGSRRWVWGTQTQIFFPAGSYVSVHELSELTGSQGVALFTYHGYLVDVP
jgi:hypothetical protein